MAWRLRQAQDRVHGLSVSGVQQRLAALLLQQAREQGEKMPGGTRMKLDLTHQEKRYLDPGSSRAFQP